MRWEDHIGGKRPERILYYSIQELPNRNRRQIRESKRWGDNLDDILIIIMNDYNNINILNRYNNN